MSIVVPISRAGAEGASKPNSMSPPKGPIPDQWALMAAAMMHSEGRLAPPPAEPPVAK